MKETGEFVLVFFLIFLVGVVFDCVSQFANQHKSLKEIRVNFKKTVVRMFLMTIVLIVSALVFYRFGWDRT
jgi:hypothetical protein